MRAFPWRPLFLDAGFLEDLQIRSGAAVKNGNLRPVHFDQDIVHSRAEERGHEMLDGADHDSVAPDAGRLESIHNLVVVCGYGGPGRHVRPAKPYAEIGRSRL